jgi:CheY-like chemotaxis protein
MGESTPLFGFEITAERHEQVRSGRSAAEQRMAKLSNPPRVMIVEDEGIFSLDLQKQLTLGGFADVEVVNNAEDALHQIEKCKPDIILMDIRLGGSMDGVEAACIIRSRYDLPVVYITAHADAEILERARMTEPAGFLVKPVGKNTVKATIIMVLHNLRMKDERSKGTTA